MRSSTMAAPMEECVQPCPLGPSSCSSSSCPVCRCSAATVGPRWAMVSACIPSNGAALLTCLGSLLIPAYADWLSLSLELVPGAAPEMPLLHKCMSWHSCWHWPEVPCARVPCSPTSGMAAGFATLMDEESSSDEEDDVLQGKVALAEA